MAEIVAALTSEALDVGSAIDRVRSPELGGIAVFVGTVRTSPAADTGEGREVVELDYDAHPDLAGDRLREICEEAATKWDVRRVAALHRSGRCLSGEPTVVVACGAPHRADALEACRWIIDTIKSTVPIWKREVYEDGDAWVGAEGDPIAGSSD